MAFYYQPLSVFDVPFVAPQRRPNRSYHTRSSPLLGDDLLNLLIPLVVESQAPQERQRIRSKLASDPPAKWAECVQMPGFSPNEVNAEVKGDKVVIIGRRESGDGENTDTYEMKRTVPIPADVDASKVVCNFVPRRFVLVEGPRSKAVKPPPQEVPVFNTNDVSEAEKKPEAAAAGAPAAETGGAADVAAAKKKAEGDATSAKKVDEDYWSEDDSMVNVLKVGANPPAAPAESTEYKPANFELMINLKNFKPSDIVVSREGRRLVIDASREEAGEFCIGKETFHREVELPENADVSKLRCFFREDGVMMVSAPFTKDSDVVIPIKFEGAEEEEGEESQEQA